MGQCSFSRYAGERIDEFPQLRDIYSI